MKDWAALRKFMGAKLTGVLMEGRFINQVLKFEMYLFDVMQPRIA